MGHKCITHLFEILRIVDWRNIVSGNHTKKFTFLKIFYNVYVLVFFSEQKQIFVSKKILNVCPFSYVIHFIVDIAYRCMSLTRRYFIKFKF